MARVNVDLTDLQSLVVSPTLLSRSDEHTSRLDGHSNRLDVHDISINSLLSNTVTPSGTTTFTGDVTVEGKFITTGTYADVANLDISDNLIGLNRGLTTRDATRDSGILIERGDASNVFMGFDESAEKLTMGTTTSLPSHAGSMQNFTVGTLVANTEGTHTGSVSVQNSKLNTSTAQDLAIFKSGVGANNANVDIGNFSLTANELISVVSTGAPLKVTSTTQVANLHASQVTGDVSGGNVTVGTGTTLTVSAGTLVTSAGPTKNIIEGASSNLNIGTYSLTANKLISVVATGAPLTVTSTTQVANLHASQVTGDVTVGTGKTLTVSAGTLTTSAAQKKDIVEGVGASLDLSATDLSVNTLEINVADGTPPMIVTSTTQVANLHASQVTGDVSGGNVTVGTGKTLTVSAGTLTTSATQNKDIVEGVGATLDLTATDLSVNTLEIDVADGTAPMIVTSTTQVANLHASQVTGAVDGVVGSNTPALGIFTGVALNTLVCHKSQSFSMSLDIYGYATLIDGSIITDAVIENANGADMLDVTGLAVPTHILIKNAYVKLTVASTKLNNGVHDGMLTLGQDTGNNNNTTLTNQGLSNTEILGSNINIIANSGTTPANPLQVFITSPVITEIANSRLYFINKTTYTAGNVSGNNNNNVAMTVVLDYDLLTL